MENVEKFKEKVRKKLIKHYGEKIANECYIPQTFAEIDKYGIEKLWACGFNGKEHVPFQRYNYQLARYNDGTPQCGSFKTLEECKIECEKRTKELAKIDE